jgi:serpin B
MDTTGTARSDFATRLYNQLAATQAGTNLFLSPFSIRVALAMCAVGAKGQTRRVLAELLEVPESVEEQNRQFARLLQSVQGDGDRLFPLVTANALWGQQGYHFNPNYKEAVAEFYDGDFKEINFRAQPDEAVKTINTWVSDKTRAKIQELMQRDFIGPDTRLILTNAIYFKGRWETEFEKADTSDENWHGPNGTVQVPMMHQSGGYLYYESGSFQALDLPYPGRQLSLLIVLPRQKDGLASLESQWAGGDTYQHVTDGLDHAEMVLLSLPRFQMETTFKLKPVLCDLGAGLPFNADFRSDPTFLNPPQPAWQR